VRIRSRRELLRDGATLAGAALCWPGKNAAEILELRGIETQSGPALQFPSEPRARLAVASWPFRAYIESPTNDGRDRKVPGMDLREFAAQVKDKFGVPGVEPLSTHFSSTDNRYLHSFREAIDKAGVHVVNIPVDNVHSYYDSDPALRQKAVQNGKKWVDVAVVLGSPSVRTSIAEAKNAKPSVEVAAAELHKVADYGASKSVLVNLENDNLVSEDAFFVVKVVDAVHSPFLRALPDFCNSMQKGDENFNYSAVKAMFSRAYNICHVKDSEVSDSGKVFRVDLKRSFDILKASGFGGYCSMEWEGGGDPHHGTNKLIAASLQNLA
jgi:sugar phosphate isomerase/epimerase